MQFVVNDFDTYSEFTTFVASANSFKAEPEANDDLVMTLVIFAWVSTQKYFKEIVTHDVRKQMQLENMNQVDEITPPSPVIDDGLDFGSLELIDGDLWEKASSNQTYSNYVKDMLRKI